MGKGSPGVLPNHTLAPWEYFRMCGLLKSEWECHHKSVTHPHTSVTKPRENTGPTKQSGTKNNEGGRRERKEEGREERRKSSI